MNEPGTHSSSDQCGATAVELADSELAQLASRIKNWGEELGFQQLGITDTQLKGHEKLLLKWLEKGYHGSMEYMERHGTSRSRPAELVPGTVRVISARMDYLTDAARPAAELMDEPDKALISRYAMGRDYHKVMRKRLQKLAQRMEQEIGPFGYRVFVDSAPVLEKALAEKAGLGWIGKHSNLLNLQAGSWFFLGEIYTDLPLPVDRAGREPLRGLCALHQGLPHRRDRRPVPGGCTQMHFLPDDRTQRGYSRRTAPTDGQPDFRLR